MKNITLDDAEYIRDTCLDLLEVFRKYATDSENARNMISGLEVMAREAKELAQELLFAQEEF